jgi:hypothetical protein
VYAKLKLLALCPEARKALEDGKISESIALLVARIPVHDLQRKALKDDHGASGRARADDAPRGGRPHPARLHAAPRARRRST